MNNRKLSAEHFRVLVNQATAGISETDLEGNHIFANRKFCETLGYTDSELLATNLCDITHPDDLPQCLAALAHTVATGEAVVSDKRLLTKTGAVVWVNDTVAVIVNAAGGGQSVMAVAVDISESKRAAEILREKVTLQKMIGVQENERKRIARDIHDHIGQSITALQLKLQLVQIRFQAVPDFGGALADVQRLVEKLNAETDFLAWELRPSVLDDLGLTEALKNYAAEWSAQFHTAAEFHPLNLKGVKLLPEIEINLYRIAQEAMNNAAKYAAAKNVAVLLERREDAQLILVIEDDGKGFDVGDKTGVTGDDRGMGLLGMKERAEMVGGTIEIESSAETGTSIYVRVPLRPADDAPE